MKRTTMLVLAILVGMAVQQCIAGEVGDDALADGGGAAQMFEGTFPYSEQAKVACNPQWAQTPPVLTAWMWSDSNRVAARPLTSGISLDAAGCLTISGGRGAPYQVVIR